MPHRRTLALLCLLLLFGAGCRPATAVSQPAPQQSDTPAVTAAATATPLPTAAATATATRLATATPAATATPIPTATATATATVTPSPTRVVICADRLPQDDLLTVVTLQYGLSREYEPADLVPLADYLPQSVTLGYPSEVRAIILEPLLALIADMEAAGLRPQIISGYRSYAAQAIAWNKWNEKYPDHANIISAPPGHSEHQLGTVVDFGSPELPGIVGEPGIEFHTYFYKTSEGQWLAENAHRYGFTLSYPLEAFETTGFYYEPWHHRYVGVEMATMLHETGQTLTAYQLANGPLPCAP